jgi:hypothetical protein
MSLFKAFGGIKNITPFFTRCIDCKVTAIIISRNEVDDYIPSFAPGDNYRNIEFAASQCYKCTNVNKISDADNTVPLSFMEELLSDVLGKNYYVYINSMGDKVQTLKEFWSNDTIKAFVEDTTDTTVRDVAFFRSSTDSSVDIDTQESDFIHR